MPRIPSPRPLLLPALIAVLVGLAACGGDDSPTAPAAPQPPAVIDTAAPAPPTGLAACRLSPWTVKIAWEPNVSDPDLAGYRITRTGLGATVVLVDEPTAACHFVDDHPIAAVAVYAVTAVDAAGNESPAATIVHAPHGRAPEREIR